MTHLLTLFLATYPPIYLPQDLLLGVLGLAGLLIVVIGLWLTIALVKRVWRIRWKTMVERRYLHLRNNGNLPATLQISAISLDGQLNFGYVLEGAALTPTISTYTREAPVPQGQITPVVDVIAPAAPISPTTSAPMQPVNPGSATNPSPAVTGSAEKPAAMAANAAKTASAVEGKTNSVFGLVGVFAMVLGTLGALLPGDLGKAILQKSTELQQSVAKARFKTQAPVQKVKQVKRLRDQTTMLQEDLKGQVPNSAQVVQANQATKPQSEPEAQLDSATPGATRVASLEPKRTHTTYSLPRSAVRREVFACQTVLLPPLPPEASLTVELDIEARNLYHKGEHTFWLLNQTVAPVFQPEPEKTVQRVKVQQLPFIYWFLSVLLSVSIVIFNAAWVGALVYFLARLLVKV